MSNIDAASIRRLAAVLARHMLPDAADDAVDEATLAQLTPAVAAFLGMLTTLADEQDDALWAAAERFLSDPATAAGLRDYAGGSDTVWALYNRLVDAGLAPNPRLYTYFPAALDQLLAVAWLGGMGPAEARADSPLNETLAAPGDAPPFLHMELFAQSFVDAWQTNELAYIEPGRAVAEDGETLYEWSPPPMAESPAETVGPDGGLPGEWLGETGIGTETVNGGHTGSANPLAPQPPSDPEPEPPAAVALRLDAALPDRVTVGRAFDLAVAVRRPASPPLAPDDLTRRESAPFAAVWPDDARFVSLRLQISAPDCDIHGGDSRPFRLLAGQDGPTVYFQLTPRRAGAMSVIITVYQEVDWVGSTRLRTEAAEEARGGMTVAVDSAPLGDTETNQTTLWRALTDGYNESELQNLCFELGIDHEELAGETKSARARELVRYAQRHNLTARLVELVMAGRPHLLAPN